MGSNIGKEVKEEDRSECIGGIKYYDGTCYCFIGWLGNKCEQTLSHNLPSQFMAWRVFYGVLCALFALYSGYSLFKSRTKSVVLKGAKSTYKNKWTLTSKKLIIFFVFLLNLTRMIWFCFDPFDYNNLFKIKINKLIHGLAFSFMYSIYMAVLFIWYTLAENIYMRSESQKIDQIEQDQRKKFKGHALPTCILVFKHLGLPKAVMFHSVQFISSTLQNYQKEEFMNYLIYTYLIMTAFFALLLAEFSYMSYFLYKTLQKERRHLKEKEYSANKKRVQTKSKSERRRRRHGTTFQKRKKDDDLSGPFLRPPPSSSRQNILQNQQDPARRRRSSTQSRKIQSFGSIINKRFQTAEKAFAGKESLQQRLQDEKYSKRLKALQQQMYLCPLDDQLDHLSSEEQEDSGEEYSGSSHQGNSDCSDRELDEQIDLKDHLNKQKIVQKGFSSAISKKDGLEIRAEFPSSWDGCQQTFGYQINKKKQEENKKKYKEKIEAVARERSPQKRHHHDTSKSIFEKIEEEFGYSTNIKSNLKNIAAHNENQILKTNPLEAPADQEPNRLLINNGFFMQSMFDLMNLRWTHQNLEFKEDSIKDDNTVFRRILKMMLLVLLLLIAYGVVFILIYIVTFTSSTSYIIYLFIFEGIQALTCLSLLLILQKISTTLSKTMHAIAILNSIQSLREDYEVRWQGVVKDNGELKRGLSMVSQRFGGNNSKGGGIGNGHLGRSVGKEGQVAAAKESSQIVVDILRV